MNLPRLAIIGIITLASGITGCRCPSSCCIPATPNRPCDLPRTAVQDTPLAALSLVADCRQGGCVLQPLPNPSETYQVLTPEDCQCRAAANANVANMVELEEHWASVIIECDSNIVQENLCLQRDLLELHAADVRNKSAAVALEAFYQLAGLEARKHCLEAAILEATRTRDRADRLRETGLPADIDRDAISTRLSELEDQRLQLQYARIQLNGQLQKLLGCPVTEACFFWPQVDWQTDFTPLDAEAEVAAGMPQRFDLRGVELVLCNLEKNTVRVARGVLSVADATLGSVEPTEGVIHRLRCLGCYDMELDVRCRQLAMLYNDAEQTATAEIKGGVYQVVLQQQRVALARNSLEERQSNLESLSARRDADDLSIFEISAARGRVFDAESRLIEQLTTLKVAEVRLRQAQAVLASECGFSPKLCCEGTCNGHCIRCQARTCRACDVPCRCEECCRK